MEEASEVGRVKHINRPVAPRAFRFLEELETFSGCIVLRSNHLANLEGVLKRVHHSILTLENNVLSSVRAQFLLLDEGFVAEYLPWSSSRTTLAKNAVRVYRVAKRVYLLYLTSPL